MLAGFDNEYIVKAGDNKPPWEAEGTYHLSVWNSVLTKTLRAVAVDPRAYALLRMAETRTAAGRLAAVPAEPTGADLLQPTKNARALGVLDGIADAATSQNAQEARKWHATVFGRLLTEQADQAEPAGPLTAAWLQELRNTPEKQRAERLRAQGVDMARTWAQARTMDEPTRQDLITKVKNSARNAREEVKHWPLGLHRETAQPSRPRSRSWRRQRSDPMVADRAQQHRVTSRPTPPVCPRVTAETPSVSQAMSKR
ncbi:hypothetical protein ACIQU4_39330 [Streptomyces sp. NPDC090741]|uniref:hypothetical protein n=1 Tax=Streptomyces sp. NPDC090741 TaxID=3365967 RepID=UPI0037F38008